MTTPDRYRRRLFDATSTDPQHVIAQALAQYDQNTDIGPATWWRAGQAVRALKAAGLLRTARERKTRERKAATRHPERSTPAGPLPSALDRGETDPRASG